MKRILLIDDEKMILDVVQSVLTRKGYEIETTADPETGVKLASEQHFDLIVVDLRMPNRTGADVVRCVIANRPDQRIVVATGFPSDPIAFQALEAGAVAILQKPFEIESILDYLDG